MNMAITPSRIPPCPVKHTTNCRNCGAPIHGNICEYCGTSYGEQLYVKMHVGLSKEEMERAVKELRKHRADPIMFLPSTTEIW